MPELLSRLADAKLPETWRVPAWAIFEPAEGSGPGFVAFHFQSWDEKRGEHAPPEVVIREYRRERGGWGIWTSMLFELDTALGIGRALGRIERRSHLGTDSAGTCDCAAPDGASAAAESHPRTSRSQLCTLDTHPHGML